MCDAPGTALHYIYGKRWPRGPYRKNDSLMFALLLVQSALACPDTDALLHRAREALFNSETDEELSTAMLLIEQAQSSLTCGEVPARPDQIAAVFQIGGVILTQQGRAEGALEWFQDAARQAPLVPFDTTLTRARDATAAFDAARDRMRGADAVDVSTTAGVLIDGWPLAPGDSRPVLPGEHLVQYVGGDGSMVSELLDIRGDIALGPAAPEPTATPSARGRGAGLALLAAGAGLLSGGAYWQFYAGAHSYAGSPDASRYRLTADLLTLTGLGTLGAGVAILTITPDDRTLHAQDEPHLDLTTAYRVSVSARF